MAGNGARIGVDIASLRPPFTGIANYEIQLLSRLVERMPETEFLGFGVYRWQKVDAEFIAQCKSDGSPLPARKASALRYNTVLHHARNMVRERMFAASALRRISPSITPSPTGRPDPSRRQSFR